VSPTAAVNAFSEFIHIVAVVLTRNIALRLDVVAREGHSMIPSTYPDSPLQNWLGRQQEMLYQYGEGNPVCLRPIQVKILCILGVSGKKRDAPAPKMSSRVLRMKYPLK